MKFLHGGKKLIFPPFSAKQTCSPRAAREEATGSGGEKKALTGFGKTCQDGELTNVIGT